MTTIYGIKNCDTVKKALKWLQENNIEHQFHDFRADGIDETQVKQWLEILGWETLVNKRSTSWKELSEEQRKTMNDENALTAILATPTLIKRPLLNHKEQYFVGFKTATYETIF